ncbi:hypothetical protein ANCCAN_07692 [Ancylostoma caninum]|uniref:Uncharacterized protein n=1 Tax=Ancylostoma caninum TaxID=29170 RepID=A0A368GPJ4_ANCCA|nr:hypothetical protein ANCCAN_07692 [Ancylostoma caninum]
MDCLERITIFAYLCSYSAVDMRCDPLIGLRSASRENKTGKDEGDDAIIKDTVGFASASFAKDLFPIQLVVDPFDEVVLRERGATTSKYKYLTRA